MNLDRVLQREILEKLSGHYGGIPQVLDAGATATGAEDAKYVTNLLYLEEHGLIDAGLHQSLDGRWSQSGARITARGLDFLADDGGLSAILGTVTVKLHDDTIRDLIEARIVQSSLPAEEKTGLVQELKKLRGESIKHLTMKLIDAGLENAPKAIELVQKFLESA